MRSCHDFQGQPRQGDAALSGDGNDGGSAPNLHVAPCGTGKHYTSVSTADYAFGFNPPCASQFSRWR